MIRNIMAVVLTLSIPFFLFVQVWQSSRYSQTESELVALTRTQTELVSLNKRYISGISVLSSPERIEKVATEELNMRKARSEEITRISLGREGSGG